MNKKCSKCYTENPLYAKYCRRCGKKFDEEPEIADFRLNAIYRVGDVVDFSWNVVNADKVTLNGMVVTGKTRVPVTIKGDEDFKLVARKGKIKIEKTITVHPQKLKIQPEPKPTPVTSVSVVKRKKWTLLLGLFALTSLLIVLLNDNMIPSYLNIGYSGWQNMKLIITTLCWTILMFCIGSTIYSIIRYVKKIKNY